MTSTIRKRVRLGYFCDRFTMYLIDNPNGDPLQFNNYDQAQRFINQHNLGPCVSPVEITQTDRDLDQMHISHAIGEILSRLPGVKP